MKLKSLILLLLFIILVSSCQSQQNQDCPFQDQLNTNYDLCGFVEVPNDWNDMTKGSTAIAYMVIKSKSLTPKDDPIVFVQGGPGGNVLSVANLYAGLLIDPDRDFILYDQRGIGFSNAICPDLSASFLEVLAKNIEMEDEDEALLDASSDCIKSLSSKNFKTVFGTTESARDLEALRVHLGYEHLNLFGGSYGTRLSMKYMELYPDKVRSAILSGLFPPEIRLYDGVYSNLNRSLDKLFESCESDANCKQKYPELRSDFEAICKKLDVSPESFNFDEKEVVINKQDFLLLLQQLLYDRQTIAIAPSFIMAFKNNNSHVVRQSLQAFSSRLNVINAAAYWSVMSPDESGFNNQAKLQIDGEKHPILSSGIGFFGSDPEVMKKWPVNKGVSTPMVAIHSNIPTLLISGAWDPITPPENAEVVAKKLSNSTHIVFPNDGHCPINPCFFSMAKTFVNNPAAEVDNSCINATNPIRFN